MDSLSALILGLVEGLTEFVPVSSTGHLILTNKLLGLHGEGIDAFSVVIQLGALLAAVIYYRKVLWQTATGLLRGDQAALRLALSLFIAAVPVLGLGYLFSKRIKALLFGPLPVAAALLVGGVVMIAVDAWQRRRQLRQPEQQGQQRQQGQQPPEQQPLPEQQRQPQQKDPLQTTPRQALLIGLVQAAALWPGTSRSMACMVGGQLAGLSTAAAADFAFLLAIPTLGTATIYDLYKSHDVLMRDTGLQALLIGLLVSFVVGWLVISALLRFLRRFGLSIFGYYRIVLAVIVYFVMPRG